MSYLISYPDGFRKEQKYPLLIFLHGRGARAQTTEKLHQYPSLSHLQKRQNKRGYILLAPHCKSGNWNEWMGSLIRLLETFRDLPYVDKTRLYLTGNSMGGYRTWMLAALRSHWFAAAIPICGGGMAWNAHVLKMPIWAFHGLEDNIVSPNQTIEMVEALKPINPNLKYDFYEGVGHDSWEKAFTEPTLK